MTVKTREEIITSMCYTARHDYGLHKDDIDVLESGLTDSERLVLWRQMSQLYDHCVAPYMEFKHV